MSRDEAHDFRGGIVIKPTAWLPRADDLVVNVPVLDGLGVPHRIWVTLFATSE